MKTLPSANRNSLAMLALVVSLSMASAPMLAAQARNQQAAPPDPDPEAIFDLQDDFIAATQDALAALEGRLRSTADCVGREDRPGTQAGLAAVRSIIRDRTFLGISLLDGSCAKDDPRRSDLYLVFGVQMDENRHFEGPLFTMENLGLETADGKPAFPAEDREGWTRALASAIAACGRENARMEAERQLCSAYRDYFAMERRYENHGADFLDLGASRESLRGYLTESSELLLKWLRFFRDNPPAIAGSGPADEAARAAIGLTQAAYVHQVSCLSWRGMRMRNGRLAPDAQNGIAAAFLATDTGGGHVQIPVYSLAVYPDCRFAPQHLAFLAHALAEGNPEKTGTAFDQAIAAAEEQCRQISQALDGFTSLPSPVPGRDSPLGFFLTPGDVSAESAAIRPCLDSLAAELCALDSVLSEYAELRDLSVCLADSLAARVGTMADKDMYGFSRLFPAFDAHMARLSSLIDSFPEAVWPEDMEPDDARLHSMIDGDSAAIVKGLRGGTGEIDGRFNIRKQYSPNILLGFISTLERVAEASRFKILGDIVGFRFRDGFLAAQEKGGDTAALRLAWADNCRGMVNAMRASFLVTSSGYLSSEKAALAKWLVTGSLASELLYELREFRVDGKAVSDGERLLTPSGWRDFPVSDFVEKLGFLADAKKIPDFEYMPGLEKAYLDTLEALGAVMRK